MAVSGKPVADLKGEKTALVSMPTATTEYVLLSGADDSDASGAWSQALHGTRHPQERAWCFSRLLLSWATPLMRLGHRKQLDEQDIWPLRANLRAQVASRKFSADYEATRSMYTAFLRSFGWRFVLTGVLFFVSMVCNLFGSVVLRGALHHRLVMVMVMVMLMQKAHSPSSVEELPR